MLSGDGNENWKKVNRLNSNKKNCARAAHFFCTFLCRCFRWPQRKTFYLHMLWKKYVLCAHQRFCCLCCCSLFFPLPLIFYPDGFSLLTASISHFLTADIKCSCCFCNKIRPLCFLSLALALSLLPASCHKSCHVMRQTNFRVRISSRISSWIFE